MPGVGGSLGQGGTVTLPLLLPPPLPLPLLPLPPVELPDGAPPSSPGSTRPPHANEASPRIATRHEEERTPPYHGHSPGNPSKAGAAARDYLQIRR
jgi:hypothetical protein